MRREASEEVAPLVSVVIPTRNRLETLRPVVEGIQGLTGSRLEVVIQDSSDGDDVRRWAGGLLRDPRIRYFRTAGSPGMCENFNAGVTNARGEYVCVIGDDDGISPSLERIAAWACRKNIDCVTAGFVCWYYWPDVAGAACLANAAGRLFVRPFSGRVSFLDPKRGMRSCADRGGQDYLILPLPKLYHGLVRRRVLERVKQRTGHYFGGLSPDIYSALTLAEVAESVAEVDFPLTLNGTSRRSGAGQSSAGEHVGPLNSAPQLRGRDDYPWPREVPGFYSVQTIWAESAMTAFRELGRQDLVGCFNVGALAASCARRTPRYRKESMSHALCELRRAGFTAVRAVATLALEFTRFEARRAGRLAQRLAQGALGRRTKAFDGVSDAGEAMARLGAIERGLNGVPW